MTEQEMTAALEKVANEQGLRHTYDCLSAERARIEKEIENFASASRNQINHDILPRQVDLERELQQIAQLKDRILKESPVGKRVKQLAEERRAVDFDKNSDPIRLGLIAKIDRCIRERREGEAEAALAQLRAAERRVQGIDEEIDSLLRSIGLGSSGEQYKSWDQNVQRMREATIAALTAQGYEKEAKQYLGAVSA